MKIRKSSIFSFICLFVWIMLSILGIPGSVRVIVRTLVLGVLIIKKVRKANFIFWLFALYMALALISVILYDYSINNVLNTFSALSMPMGMILLFSGRNEESKKLLIKQCLVIYSFILLIDVIVLITTPNGLSQNGYNQAIYFSGGKFSALYIFMAWLMFLFLIKKDVNRKWIIVLTALGMIYSYNLDCMTGVVAVFTFGLIMIVPQSLSTGKKGLIWPVGVTVLTFLVVILQIQTTVPWMRTLITQLLNSSLDLTGRTNIYNAIPKIMEGHWTLGWGYTSTRIINVTGLANMQNGFLQLIYSNGILGTLPYLIIILISIKKTIDFKNQEISRVFMAIFVSFLVIAIGEIPFNTTVFYLLIGCIFMETDSENTVICSEV